MLSDTLDQNFHCFKVVLLHTIAGDAQSRVWIFVAGRNAHENRAAREQCGSTFTHLLEQALGARIERPALHLNP
ncbi:hypothetical protein [Microvirga lotononidis]|uniref:hypothetical protein n=1 Tax=Microvirga lotononidis TaxID=864069 RepID=UPI0012B51BFF|nr:hypothetical protein [Microvirga lotononidis]WQO31398.1 hypothetical protein U0023_34510 [Microvirga lotononidis]